MISQYGTWEKLKNNFFFGTAKIQHSGWCEKWNKIEKKKESTKK